MTYADSMAPVAFFAFLAVASVALFSFIAVASWSDARRKERESYYRNDMLKKLAESSGAGAAAAMELLREDARLQARGRRQDMKIAGTILLAVGLGILIFLHALIPHKPIYMAGPLLMLIGAALFGSSYFLSATAE
ncbi:MAG TPA: hypothetical protein VME18_02875 [Acidobacteriaceae bacterium]|nr:hypothetical protein [Acidobacteriaceae bacterium]